MEMIALDCHKHYSVASVQTPRGDCLAECRIEHRRGRIEAFLKPYSVGCPAARTRLKNRIHSVVDKYGFQDQFEQVSDLFGVGVRDALQGCLRQLPPQAAYTSGLLLKQLDRVQATIQRLEKRMARVFRPTVPIQLLTTLPGVGRILGVVIALEIGDIRRFPGAGPLASYAGTVPRVHSSGGKTQYGRTRPDVNHYLKWAYVEAGNAVAVHRQRFPHRHVSQLYNRIRSRRGHAPAVVAVARHLAEATYWMLSKNEPYRERGIPEVSSKGV